MARSFADALKQEAARRFVGRRAELAQLRAALKRAASGPSLVSCCGLVGVGKTTLTRQFIHLVAKEVGKVVWLRGSDGFKNKDAIERSLRNRDRTSFDALGTGERPDVLIIDGIGQFGELRSWLLKEAVVAVGPKLLTVVLGYYPVAAAELAPRLAAHFVEIELGRFSPLEAARCLHFADIPLNDHQAVLSFTEGHPLALAMVCARGAAGFDEGIRQAIIRTLMARFSVYADEGWLALQALSVVSKASRALLASMLEPHDQDAHGFYDRLARLPCVDEHDAELQLDPLMRKILYADLTSRLPDRTHAFQASATEWLIEEARGADTEGLMATAAECYFANRRGSVLDGEGATVPMGPLSTDEPTLNEVRCITRWVSDFLGPMNLRCFQYWLGHPAAELRVLRDGLPSPMAALLRLKVEQLTDDDISSDPVVWGALDGEMPWRNGRSAAPGVQVPGSEFDVDMYRFFICRDGIVPGPAAMSGLQATCSLLTFDLERKVRWTVLPLPSPGEWRREAAIHGISEVPSGTAPMDGISFAPFVADTGPDQPLLMPPSLRRWTFLSAHIRQLTNQRRVAP